SSLRILAHPTRRRSVRNLARVRCWRHDWVLDLDIKGFFDSIDWELLLKAVRHHTDCSWVLLYVERWLKAPEQIFQPSFLTNKKTDAMVRGPSRPIRHSRSGASSTYLAKRAAFSSRV